MAAFSKLFFNELPWELSWAIGAVMGYALSVRQKLNKTQEELAELRQMFAIADTELVRVSAAVAEHDDKFWDLRQEIIEVSNAVADLK